MAIKGSIRKNLLTLYIVLSIFPLLLLGGVLSWQNYIVQKEMVQDLHTEISRLALREILHVTEHLEEDLQMSAKLTKLLKLNRENQYIVLSKLITHKGIVHGNIIKEVSLLDSRGSEQIRLSESSVFTLDDLRNRSDAAEFVFPSTRRETYYGPLYINPESGAPLFSLSIPLIDPQKGNIEGVLAAVIKFNFMWEKIADLKIGESGIAYILDNEGRVIAHKDPSIVLRGTHFDLPPKMGFVKGLTGKVALISAENITLGENVIHFVTELPMIEALMMTKRSLLITSAFLIFTLINAVVLGFMVIRKIIRPVESLSATAVAISKGDITQKAQITADNELGILANTFNTMTTKLVETIDSLQENREVLERSQQAGKIGSWSWNLQTGDLYWSDGTFLGFGLEPNEITPSYETFEKFIHPEDRKVVNDCVKSALDGKAAYSFDARMIRKDGAEWDMHAEGVVFRDEKGNPIKVVGIQQDITERKKLEQEIQRSHKLESVGVLAGGIAHDFNNLLSGIMNNIYLSKRHLETESRAYHHLVLAEKALLRSSELTQQLLTFSRGGAPVKRASSISDIVRETAEFTLRGSNVKCEYKISENIWTVDVDRSQISQVIQNIIINAEQAMPGGGMITVEIENAIVGSGTGVPQKDGSFVKITIHDKGTGISDEHLQKIFDPFFTTKDTGRGLGLAIVYSIVKNHDGYISVESELGHGTTFDIYLPASEGQIVTEQAPEEANGAGSGRVLIMDDEEFIRSSLGEVLVHMGYDVELARDGAEAVRIYEKAMKSPEPFDAVILDLTVPGGMGGEETIKILREIDSNVKAIVTSGYSVNPVLANFRDYGFRGSLSKPFKSPAELNKILHSVLTSDLNA